MPDHITMCHSKTLGWVPVHTLHDRHAKNKLAEILRDPVEAAKQFSSEVFIAERNVRAHYVAKGGLRWEVQVTIPLLIATPDGRATMEGEVKRFRSRKTARAQLRHYRSVGFRPRMFLIDEHGNAERRR